MNDNRSYDFDWLLFSLVLILAGAGLVMLLSASYFLAEVKYENGYYFLALQIKHTIVGLIIMLALARIPYQFWLKWVYPILLASIVLLAVVHLPGLGVGKDGVMRWLRLGPLTFQPSEAAKLAVVIYMAYSLSRKGEKVGSFVYGLLPHLIVLGALCGLILVGKDLGTAACVAAIALIMMFVAGTRVWHMSLIALAAAGVLYWQIVSNGWRMARITAFMDPWADPSDSGYQIIHSFYAFASGGLFGQGPGASMQKLFYLPEGHNDFILAVAAEELGLVGVAIIAILFLVVIYRGVSISRSAPDFFGIYLALGCTLVIGLPAFFNMSVVTGLVPNKGLPLPFFSYGGTNLLICYAAMGLLLNVAGQSRAKRVVAPAAKRSVELRSPRLSRAATATGT